MLRGWPPPHKRKDGLGGLEALGARVLRLVVGIFIPLASFLCGRLLGDDVLLESSKSGRGGLLLFFGRLGFSLSGGNLGSSIGGRGHGGSELSRKNRNGGNGGNGGNDRNDGNVNQWG